MRAHALQERHQRLYQATTDSRHALPVADNMLARDFSPGGPHQVWTADTPYLGTDEGWRYLAIVLDRFNREVMGWSLKPRMTADRVTDALNLAGFRRQPPGVLPHSDRGSPYASRARQKHTPGIRQGWLHEQPGQLRGPCPDRKRVQPLQA
jgi:putative transposase